MILTTIISLIVVIGVVLYISNKNKDSQLGIEKQLKSKLHEHIAPDGTFIEHRHTYTQNELSENIVTTRQVLAAKSPIQRAWERLDLEEIRRKYQPYTVAEMHEMWSSGYRSQFGPNYPYQLDETYPQDEWLERNLALGQPFSSWSDYRMVLQRRIYMIDHENQWRVANEDRKEYMRKALDLPSDIDTWEEYEEAYLKFFIVASNAELQAEEADPSILGGTTRTDGTFTPFKENTVYAHINPKSGYVKFTGVSLNEKEEKELATYGVVPEGIKVIYTDEGGKPLPSDTPSPRFYERDMASLEKSLNLLQQQIEEHELLLELDAQLDPPNIATQTDPVPHEHPQDHEHDHGHETPQTPDEKPEQQRRQPDAKRTPPPRKIPPELRKPDAVNQWFKELQLLHGGQLPKDLQELRKIITELEKIREEGEAIMKPPERPKRPTPPLPPEGSPPPPPNEDD